MRTFLVSLLALATALAGCSDGKGSTDDGPATCPDGRVVDPMEHEHGDDGGMENMTEQEMAEHEMMEDPCFVAPWVEVIDLQTTLGVFVTDPFQWTIHNGSVPSGHSMLTSLRYSEQGADPANLTDAASWGTELARKEHNNLPVTIDGTVRFDVPGTFYLRVYAQVRGEGFSDHDYWSPEIRLNVTPVTPTGATVTVTHPVGPVGDLNVSSNEANLGDALVFQNEDVLAHGLTLQGVACPADSIADVAMGESSEPILFMKPGSCAGTTTGDASAKSFTITVLGP